MKTLIKSAFKNTFLFTAGILAFGLSSLASSQIAENNFNEFKTYLLPETSTGGFIKLETSPGGYELDSFFWRGSFNQADLGISCSNAQCIGYGFGIGVLSGDTVTFYQGYSRYNVVAEYSFSFVNGAEVPTIMSELDQVTLTDLSGDSFTLFGVYDSCEYVSCRSRQFRCRVEFPGDIFGLGQSQGVCKVLPYNPF